MKIKSIILIIFLPVVIISCKNETRLLGEVHEHADFKVFLNNEEFNFSQEKYMSANGRTLSPFVHLHDGDGDVIHKHIRGVTLEEFFSTLKMKFNETCFVLDNETLYCNEINKKLRMFVNGKENFDFGGYEFTDLDRILITYGSENQNNINKQIVSVTDKACIQSRKCPERGIPSDESSCLAGEGCVV